MTTSTLVKTLLHNSVADSVYKEITSRTGRYYYFLGSVLEWVDSISPPTPVDSFEYERETRKNIVLIKEIRPSDVSYVINRINWAPNVVYDQYDDLYCDQLIGVDLIAGGTGYSSNTIVTITGGGGAGASANIITTNGVVTSIIINNRGYGYTAKPNITITDNFGTGAIADTVINHAFSGASLLQNANFYVVNDNFNIYKCLDNNNNSKSTVKPADVSPGAFTTADGYKWKFMGNVPIALRNKFLTSTQMPVTTSINSQFYSGGEIKTVDVIDTGNNYNYASIVVQGDGYLSSDPYLVIQANVISQGAGYTTANVAIDPPVSASTSWTSSTAYNVGQIIKHNNNYYEITQSGTSATYNPTHTKGATKNGTTILKYLGTGITANATITSGNIAGLSNLYGMVRDVVITNNGSGYISAPNITITGNGYNATAIASIQNNNVNRITITDSGKEYTSAPTVTIGNMWAANANVVLNTQVFHGTRLYTISTGGYSNTTAPTHTLGTQTLGNANFTFAGTSATGYARLKYGSGYTGSPKITITGDGTGANIIFESEKTEAVIYPYVENNKITRVSIEDGGIGYTRAALTVVGDGANADFSVNFSKGDIDTLQSTSELLAISGAIHTVDVVSGGYGYSNVIVSISGDGTGATANATIVNGRITKINMITEGSGYTQASVTITPTSSTGGAGAIARAILPPYGGHGKDTVSELFARSLAFYTTIGQEKNQGFVVTNDYRQFGIIKEIRNYNNNRFFNGTIGSGCWLISGNINTNLFKEDTEIVRTSDNAKFVIVSSSSTGMLVVSSNNKTPLTSDILREPTGNTFSVTGVTTPDIDKYSGELLYIDNRQAFTTSDDQAVSIKTVFKY